MALEVKTSRVLWEGLEGSYVGEWHDLIYVLK